MKKNTAYPFLIIIFVFTAIYFTFKSERNRNQFKSVRLRQLLDYQDIKIAKAKTIEADSKPRRPASKQMTTMDSKKDQPMLTLEDSAGEWLMSLATGSDIKKNRSLFLAQAQRHPLESLDLVIEILKEIPRDQTEFRDHTLGFIMDLASEVKKNKDAPYYDNFFALVHSVALSELKFSEYAPTDLANGMNKEQLDILVHDGFLVESKGQFQRSTLSNKVMAIKLAQLDTDVKRKSDFKHEVETLSDNLVDPFTKETLQLVLLNTK